MLNWNLRMTPNATCSQHLNGLKNVVMGWVANPLVAQTGFSTCNSRDYGAESGIVNP